MIHPTLSLIIPVTVPTPCGAQVDPQEKDRMKQTEGAYNLADEAVRPETSGHTFFPKQLKVGASSKSNAY